MKANSPSRYALSVLIFFVVILSANHAIAGSVSGQVTYLNAGSTPLSGITVYLKNADGSVIASTITSWYGDYSFSVDNPGYYTVTASSTAKTGGINTIDALWAAKHFVGLIQLSGLSFRAGDVNGSNLVNAVDAQLIQQYYAQIISSFTVGDWVFEESTVFIGATDDLYVDFKGICYGDVNSSYYPPQCMPLPTKANAGTDRIVYDTITSLEANTPIEGNGFWILLSGAGGNILDTTDPNSAFTGISGNTYVLKWSVVTECNTSSDIVSIALAEPPFHCGNSFVDSRDGKTYGSVQIGSHCWMRENLDIGLMIPADDNQSDNDTIEKYCYNNDTAKCSVYGGMYQWNELMAYQTSPSSQGICPEGWIVPSSEAWCNMTTYVDPTVNCTPWINWTGTDIGARLREPGLDHWEYNDYYANGGTNTSGFTALGAGYHVQNGGFYGLKEDAFFWTSSLLNNVPEVWTIYKGNNKISHLSQGANGRFSLRCILDCPGTSLNDAGPNQSGVSDNTVTLAATIPATDETGTWSVFSGDGGSFNDIHNPNASFSGLGGFSYTLKWTLVNSCGNTSSDTVRIEFASYQGIPCPGVPTINYMGQQYHAIQIGTQCWLRENLNIGSMVAASDDQLNNGVTEKYCMDDDPANCDVYGGLYQWDEMMQYDTMPGGQGICPSGWHIPTMDDWCTLTVYDSPGVNCNEQFLHTAAKLKESGFSHWMQPNTGATNSSGFTALPGGYRQEDGLTYSQTTYGYIWVSNTYEYQFDGAWAYSKGFQYDDDEMYSNVGSKQRGMSVRCIKNPCDPGSSSDAGPDQLDLPGNTADLSANTPGTDEIGNWSILSGAGGNISDITSPNAILSGLPATTYLLTWTLSNNCTIFSDTIIISFAGTMGAPCPNLPTLDYEGQTYNTVQIGSQCWLKENLNVGSMISSLSNQTDNNTIEKYCYNNDPDYCAIYGGLYQWNEAMQYATTPGSQGICPAGWHIPSDSEWCTIATYLDPAGNCIPNEFNVLDAGGKMKEVGNDHWLYPNTGASNESGFTALGAGSRSLNGMTGYLNGNAEFWSSTEHATNYAWLFRLHYNHSLLTEHFDDKPLGFSIRCVKD